MANRKSNWKDSWRSYAAGVYLGICVFDFLAMPIYIEQANRRLSAVDSTVIAMQFPAEQQTVVLNTLYSLRAWEPLTLLGSGMFHISFGAILGATAFNRYREQRESNQAAEAVDESDTGPKG